MKEHKKKSSFWKSSIISVMCGILIAVAVDVYSGKTRKENVAYSKEFDYYEGLRIEAQSCYQPYDRVATLKSLENFEDKTDLDFYISEYDACYFVPNEKVLEKNGMRELQKELETKKLFRLNDAKKTKLLIESRHSDLATQDQLVRDYLAWCYYKNISSISSLEKEMSES